MDTCPSGQSCVAMAGSGVCTLEHGRTNDAGADADPGGGEFCIGGHLLGKLCLQSAPTDPVSLSGAMSINSAATTGGGCTEIHPQPGGPSLCIIAGTTIDIPAGVTVRAFAVNQGGTTSTSTNPVVLIATRAITIAGTLDVASHVHETFPGDIPVLGAGARTAVGCAATGLDGQPGKPSGSMDSFGGGGGAGGSFGTTGGAGGGGGNNNNVGHGNPVAGTVPNLLVGGCPGGSGGTGDGGMGAGGGGSGGGAVYLLAGDSITISGKINASGAGGGEGSAGMFSSGGGGGGGAGGMIGLEAPSITLSATGLLYANGGGGASGSGGKETDTGTAGGDPAGPGTAAGGGAGNDGGGAGGIGSLAAGSGAVGKNGGGSLREAAGGGGGGGGGAIRVYGVPAASIGGAAGAVSPPAVSGP
ncbi:MAG TPA: hypothetical protein VK607_20650 [Kofleriaceae bacterium]|nr:hypothetical protein [Kofleriaceae bacterium]